MNEIFNTIIVTWKQGNTITRITIYNATKQEAFDNAAFFGYIEPRWWQFWKYNEELEMTCC